MTHSCHSQIAIYRICAGVGGITPALHRRISPPSPVSSAIYLPKSPGEPEIMGPPSASRSSRGEIHHRTQYGAGPDHSALMFALRITLDHFWISSATNLPKSAGEPARTTPPKSVNRAFILGSKKARFISLLSFSMISVG